MSKKKILIVEDHALTRFGLKTAFEMPAANNSNNIEWIVFEAPNAQKCFDIINKEKIDIVIMDLGLPDINGIEATKAVKEQSPNTKVVILSSHEQEDDVINSIKAGANAYCTKDVDQDKLVYIVTSVLKGAAWFDSKIAQYVLNAAGAKEIIEEHKSNTTTENKTQETILTSREKEVLSLIVDGLSNIEIAKKLDVSINTTKAHVCNILQKLSVSDRTQAAIKAIKENIL